MKNTLVFNVYQTGLTVKQNRHNAGLMAAFLLGTGQDFSIRTMHMPSGDKVPMFVTNSIVRFDNELTNMLMDIYNKKTVFLIDNRGVIETLNLRTGDTTLIGQVVKTPKSGGIKISNFSTGETLYFKLDDFTFY